MISKQISKQILPISIENYTLYAYLHTSILF